MKRSSAIKGLAVIALFIVIVIALVCVFHLTETLLHRTEQNSEDPYSENVQDRIFLGGTWYARKKNLETVLLLGIDSRDKIEDVTDDSQQTDFVAVLIVDKAAERFQLLHLNRDTIADIPRLDMEGKKIGTYKAQLALAHAYGTTDKQRCRNAVDAVENLLYGNRIDHYVAVTMGAVPTVNDSVGGVTVQLLDDFSFMDPSYVKDAVVTLKGDHALRYVQERGALEDSSNLRRMERQQQYIGALLKQITSADAKSTDDVMKTVLDISEYMVSDYTADQLSRLFERISAYQYDGVYTVAGETSISVDGYMEFHADDSDVQSKVMELFYEPEKTK